MNRSLPLSAAAVSAFLLAAPTARAGDVVIEARGTLFSATSAVAPFTGVMVGDPVFLHIEVFVPGTDQVPGQYTNYMIDPATSFIQIGTASDTLTGDQVGIQNDFPVVDGIRMFGSPTGSGSVAIFEVDDPTGTMFSSSDITQQLGTWDSSTWSTYTFFIFGGGNNLLVADPVVTISEPVIGTTYCGPAPANSSGASAEIVGLGSTIVALNSLRLRATGLPTSSFGFFLNSRDAGFVPNPAGSQGNLCLGGSIGRFDAQIQNSGAAGTFEIDVELTAIPRPTGEVAAMAGETWRFQAWFRDANPSLTSNLSDGLEITFN